MLRKPDPREAVKMSTAAMLTSAKDRNNHPCTDANYCKQPLTPSPAAMRSPLSAWRSWPQDNLAPLAVPSPCN